MTEQQRLAGSIQTIARKYLPAAVRKDDEKAILKWSVRLADYATRLAALSVAPLDDDEAETLARASVVRETPLTYDQEHVLFIEAEDKALAELGRPYGHDGEERGALPLFTHIQMAEDLGLPLHAAEFKSFIVAGTAQ